MWWESDTGMLYVRYNDGSSTQWVVVPPNIGAAVQYIAQTLTAAEATQARSNIYAAPFDALAYSGMQINGSMDVSQQFGTGGVAGVGGVDSYTLDGWKFTKTGTMNIQIHQVLSSTFPGFTNHLQASVLTTQPTIGSDNAILRHYIEGYRFAKACWGTAAAVPVTVGFWVFSTVSGEFLLSLVNSAFAGPATTATVTANVAKYVTVTFPAQTSGTWLKDNGVGAILQIFLATPGWLNIAAGSNIFAITGVIVLPGIEAPSAARSPLIMRPYDQELLTCQRYFETLTSPASGTLFPSWAFSGSSPNQYQHWTFHVSKRVAPTVALMGGAAWGIVTPSVATSVDGMTLLHLSSPFYLSCSSAAKSIYVDARL
jgi:hypothetical protein